MKLPNILILAAGLLFMMSCSQIKEATEALAGEITEYNAEYTFQSDRFTGANLAEEIEDYMRSEDWLLTNDSENSLRFEQSTGVNNENATSRYENGSAEFTFNNSREIIELDLRLEGNYNYGTKENSLKIYNNLRDHLYE